MTTSEDKDKIKQIREHLNKVSALCRDLSRDMVIEFDVVPVKYFGSINDRYTFSVSAHERTYL